jgi:hypothetical protein
MKSVAILIFVGKSKIDKLIHKSTFADLRIDFYISKLIHKSANVNLRPLFGIKQGIR